LPTDRTAKSIHVYPSFQVAIPGDTVYMLCHSSSHIVWSKEGKILGNQPIIMLTSVTSQYMGEYKCSTKEDNTEVSKVSELQITGKLLLTNQVSIFLAKNENNLLLFR